MTQKKRKATILRFKRIIEQEGIADEVSGWLRFFGEDPDKIPIPRLAQHIKASLTGRPMAIAQKKLDQISKKRISNLVDEINDILNSDKQPKYFKRKYYK